MALSAQNVQTIAQLLMKRIVPKDADEGVAIAQLAQELVNDFNAHNKPKEPEVPPAPKLKAERSKKQEPKAETLAS